MEPMLEEFRRVAQSVAYQEPRLAVISNVTGEPATAQELCSALYWVRHVRHAVRFADGVRRLEEQRVGRFLELGPDGSLTAMAQGCLEGAGRVLVPAVRKGRPEVSSLLSAAAGVYTHGGHVDWAALFAGTGARRVDLPTYAFQRRTFWPTRASVSAGDMTGLGLTAPEHPLLGAAVELAGAEGFLFTGRLALPMYPWLRDHVVAGSVLFPGTGFLELAVRAGDQVGCDRVEELTIAAPLVLPEQGGVRFQVVVGGPDESGGRTLEVYSRPDGGTDGEPWVLHATGLLAAEGGVSSPAPFDFGVWPPRGAVPLPVDGVYEGFAEAGFAYGPVFAGLRALWRRGDEVFAEVGLPEEHEGLAGAFGVHPALLDAALHAVLVSEFDGKPGSLRLPFAWGGVSLWASGARALRVRVAQAGPEAVSLELADASGGAVATVESLVLREPSGELTGGARGGHHDGLFQVDWVKAPLSGTSPVDCADLEAVTADGWDGQIPGHVVLRVDRPGDDVADAVRAVTVRVLRLVQEWLAEERFEGSRLVVVTEGAVAVGQGVPDPVLAAVWGLVRAARAENPSRFVLVDMDVDGGAESWELVARALTSGEPELAVRDGAVHLPRLARLASGSVLDVPADGSAAWRLDILEKGTLEGLGITVCPERTESLA
ncbi:polyketide synthase dehydratase domain-containing protein, partial [Wenjunlia tyrosinilytica]|uniref:polyketide synthase dehydratase domain-containing protein n=1 Tax=Wenjunlia tyrosinilytica TaxID=1544741 RepID=UPI001E4D5EE4